MHPAEAERLSSLAPVKESTTIAGEKHTACRTPKNTCSRRPVQRYVMPTVHFHLFIKRFVMERSVPCLHDRSIKGNLHRYPSTWIPVLRCGAENTVSHVSLWVSINRHCSGQSMAGRSSRGNHHTASWCWVSVDIPSFWVVVKRK